MLKDVQIVVESFLGVSMRVFLKEINIWIGAE